MKLFLAGTIFVAADNLIFFVVDHLRLANRTGFSDRFIPQSKIAFRIAVAAVEHFSPPAAALYHFSVQTFRASQIYFNFNIFYILTFRITGTGKERAEPSDFSNHRLAALLAFFRNRFGGFNFRFSVFA